MQPSDRPTGDWPTGAATGIGSMPGTEVRETARTVLGELPDLPFLPELPDRGPGADMVGRSAGLLYELFAELRPSGWRFTDRPGRDTRRAYSWLAQDLDALEEFGQQHAGPLKVQVAGPWTLAASLELRGGETAAADSGARRDIATSLLDGVRHHIDEVRRRLPHATPVLQLDEPLLPRVLAGQLRSASGYRRVTAPDQAIAEENLRQFVAGVDAPVVVHCCAADVPITLLRRAGVRGVSLDLDKLPERADEAVGEAVEAGVRLFAGVLPSTAPDGDATGDDAAGLSDPADSVRGVRTLWHRLGLNPRSLASSVVTTPSCGLAGASSQYARGALTHAARAARTLVDDPEG